MALPAPRRLRLPGVDDLPDDLTHGLTYDEPGATRAGRLPPGYRHLSVRTRLGAGPGVYRAAGAAVLEWRMHRAVGVTIAADRPRAEPGARVVVGLGVRPLRVEAPCRVVWAEEGERRTGFGYGTLAGHPESGEEAFVVELGDGPRETAAVWLTVSSFTRPAAAWLRAAGPLAGVFQRAYARRCGRVLRGLASGPGHPR